MDRSVPCAPVHIYHVKIQYLTVQLHAIYSSLFDSWQPSSATEANKDRLYDTVLSRQSTSHARVKPNAQQPLSDPERTIYVILEVRLGVTSSPIWVPSLPLHAFLLEPASLAFAAALLVSLRLDLRQPRCTVQQKSCLSQYYPILKVQGTLTSS